MIFDLYLLLLACELNSSRLAGVNAKGSNLAVVETSTEPFAPPITTCKGIFRYILDDQALGSSY